MLLKKCICICNYYSLHIFYVAVVCDLNLRMPKERRDRSVSSDRTRAFPYPCSSSRSRHSLPLDHLESEKNVREWEEARCPVCMEHPHNAILLVCSSHDKGCRPYMCDTSYRHSNCFDQFRKSFEEASQTPIQQEEVVPVSTSPIASAPVTSETTLQGAISESSTPMHDVLCDHEKKNMVCPLCRGQVNAWMVNEPARHFMNAKPRSCSCETCDFNGTYTDLRKHARSVHPLVRPTEADPERQRNWRRLERQRDLGDLLSTLHSSLGEEESEGSTLTFDDGGLLTVFLFVRILQPRSSPRSSSWSGSSRARGQVTFRRRPSRRLWGETYDGEIESRDDDNEDSDAGTAARRHQDRMSRQPTPEN